MNKAIMKKSLSNYNYEAELKKQNIIANRKWSESEVAELPKFEKPKRMKLTTTIKNIIRLNYLRP